MAVQTPKQGPDYRLELSKLVNGYLAVLEWSPARLAKMSGQSKATISRITSYDTERNPYYRPELRTIQAIAQALELKEEEVEIIREAGLLHDIGKIGIPENILKKQTFLTEEEYAVMKEHVKNAVEMIRFLPDMNYMLPAVIAHHERYDGKGYPTGIAGDAIPLGGRCLALADSFDTMTARRPYKEPMQISYAVKELEKGKNTQFDPYLTDVFLQLIEEGKIRVWCRQDG